MTGQLNGTSTDPQALRIEITQTRADLAETVEALVAKTDVKARTKDAAAHAVGGAKTAIDHARDRVSSGAVEIAGTVRKPLPAGIIAGAAALVAVAVLIWRGRR